MLIPPVPIKAACARFNGFARPRLATATAAAASPVSIALHAAACAAWALVGRAQDQFNTAMKIEGLLMCLAILAKQDDDDGREAARRRRVDRELLDKVDGARPEVAEGDER